MDDPSLILSNRAAENGGEAGVGCARESGGTLTRVSTLRRPPLRPKNGFLDARVAVSCAKNHIYGGFLHNRAGGGSVAQGDGRGHGQSQALGLVEVPFDHHGPGGGKQQGEGSAAEVLAHVDLPPLAGAQVEVA